MSNPAPQLRADSVHGPPVPAKHHYSTSDTTSLATPPTRLLRKPIPSGSHARAASGQLPSPQPTLEALRQDVASNNDGLNATGLLIPPPQIRPNSYSRSSSIDYTSSSPGTPGSRSYSRPTTPISQPHGYAATTPPSANNTGEVKGKKKWFGKSKKEKDAEKGPVAWIAGYPQKKPYDTDSLLAAQPMNELYDLYNGDCFVHLWPIESNKGPSFKVDSSVFAASSMLTQMAFGDGKRSRQASFDSRTQRLSMDDQPRQEVNLYLPLKFGSGSTTAIPKTQSTPHNPEMDDLQTLIDVRNFFAFLCGQALVATEKTSSLFAIFMTVGNMLKTSGFSNYDGSTFGEVATHSFNSYVQELGLADCRTSREKNIEAIVLGERLKNVMLYNEAFTHAAGRHSEMLGTHSVKLDLISQVTKNRLIRATMDLEKRIKSAQLILNDFDFPMIKNSTIMNSKVSEERKEGVRFDHWWDSFTGMRKYVLGLYQARYGNWPPKASSKKNDLEKSGLSRLVCRDAYADMSSMYDLLVDRTNLTTRTAYGTDLAGAKQGPTIRAVRAVLNEYDGSSPPVKPPIPFDIPNLPTLKTTRPDFGTGDKKADLKALSKKLKDDEIARILRASWNQDAVITPFVTAFRDMEKRAAHGCTITELVELRIGQWLFMYTVLQALPMLAVDAPNVRHAQAVEYFLCEPPRGGVPWATANNASPSGAGGPGGAGGTGSGGGKTWFSVGDGGGNVVSLPTDIVEHGVEGIYRRSHCWVMAEHWTAGNPVLHEALHEQEEASSSTAAAAAHLTSASSFSSSSPPRLSPSSAVLPTPNAAFLHPTRTRSRDVSPSGVSDGQRRGSWMGGLEALSGPPPDAFLSSSMRSSSPSSMMMAGRGRPRTPVHVVDANKTFDSILGEAVVVSKKGGKKK